jgi:hypothetical protein
MVIAHTFQIQNGVFVQITRLRHRRIPEFDQQRIGVFKVSNFHGTKSLSPRHLLVSA